MNSKSKILTFVFILAAIGARAQYDCAGSSGIPFVVLKSDAASIDCTDMECSSSLCCDSDTTKCAHATGSYPCTNDEYLVAGNDHNNNSATNCCAARTACTAADCPTGYSIKSGSPMKGAPGNEVNECCDMEATTCQMVHANTGISCGNGKWLDSTLATATAGTTSTQHVSNCCSDIPTCASASCDPRYYTVGENASNYVRTCSDWGDADDCSDDGCCTLRTDLCYALVMAGSLTCTGGEVANGYLYFTVGSTTAEKQTACCVTPPTCATMTQQGIGSTSEAPQSMPWVRLAFSASVAVTVLHSLPLLQ